MSRTSITDRDVQQMLALTRPYDSDGGGDPMPFELLLDLTKLIDCEYVSVSGQDTPRWDFFSQQATDEIGSSEGPWSLSAEQDAADAAAYTAHYWASACSYPDRTGDIESVTRLSDLQSEREYHNSGMYREMIQLNAIEHEMMVCLDAGAPQRTLRLLFWRGAGVDFSDRDVAVLTLLRPHLQAAYAAAERHTQHAPMLTARQQEILNHVAAGYTNSQIARRLDVSSATVRKHLENIFARLEVTSRTAAVARADLLV